jgi:hypothetical protein
MPPPAAVPVSLVKNLMVNRKAFVINRNPARLISSVPSPGGPLLHLPVTGISVSVLERQRDKGAKPARQAAWNELVRF